MDESDEDYVPDDLEEEECIKSEYTSLLKSNKLTVYASFSKLIGLFETYQKLLLFIMIMIYVFI